MGRTTGDILQQLGGITSGLLRDKGYIAPIDVFLRLGYLTQADYERWRFRQVPILERVITINLSKISTVMHTLRRQSLRGGLRTSLTVYTSWGGRPRQRLRFSVSGDDAIETAYSTHYLRPKAKE